MRRVLVTAKVAVSVVVLATASLFLRNLLLARATHPRFDVRKTLRAEVHLPPVRYRDEALQKAHFTEALRELEAIPGMEAAAAARILPFTEESHERVDLTFSHTGQKKSTRFHSNAVSPAFFRAMGIPLLAGRGFTAEDRDGENVVIVNKNFIDRYLDGQPAIGATFRWGSGNTRETGVRIALGAARTNIAGLALMESARLLLIGSPRAARRIRHSLCAMSNSARRVATRV